MMNWLGGKLPYDEAREVLADVGGIHISTAADAGLGSTECRGDGGGTGAPTGCGAGLEHTRWKASRPRTDRDGDRWGDDACARRRVERIQSRLCVRCRVVRAGAPRTGDRGEYGHAVQSSYVMPLDGLASLTLADQVVHSLQSAAAQQGADSPHAED